MKEARRKIQEAKEKGLTSLDLSSLELTKLPDELWELTLLRELHLGNNELTALQPEIIRLSSLTRLDLRNNKFSTLPSETGQLKKLEEIYLGDNTISFINVVDFHFRIYPEEFYTIIGCKIKQNKEWLAGHKDIEQLIEKYYVSGETVKVIRRLIESYQPSCDICEVSHPVEDYFGISVCSNEQCKEVAIYVVADRRW